MLEDSKGKHGAEVGRAMKAKQEVKVKDYQEDLPSFFTLSDDRGKVPTTAWRPAQLPQLWSKENLYQESRK